jgi:hypothetical protein
LTPRIAHAVDEIQVYNAEINEVGQFSIQQHLNYTITGIPTPAYPGALISNHALNGTPEFAYGVTPWLELGLYVPWAVNGQGNSCLTISSCERCLRFPTPPRRISSMASTSSTTFRAGLCALALCHGSQANHRLAECSTAQETVLNHFDFRHVRQAIDVQEMLGKGCTILHRADQVRTARDECELRINCVRCDRFRRIVSSRKAQTDA